MSHFSQVGQSAKTPNYSWVTNLGKWKGQKILLSLETIKQINKQTKNKEEKIEERKLKAEN